MGYKGDSSLLNFPSTLCERVKAHGLDGDDLAPAHTCAPGQPAQLTWARGRGIGRWRRPDGCPRMTMLFPLGSVETPSVSPLLPALAGNARTCLRG